MIGIDKANTAIAIFIVVILILDSQIIGLACLHQINRNQNLSIFVIFLGRLQYPFVDHEACDFFALKIDSK